MPAPPRYPVLITISAAGLVAAGTVTLDRPGLGWLLAAVAVAAAAGVAATDAGTRIGYAWGAVALSLVAVGTVRAAGWLYALCLPVAVLCGVQALVGGWNLRGLFTGVAGVVRGMPWVGGAVRDLAPRAAPRHPVRLLLSVTVSAVLLLVFGGLLASADPAFATAIDRVSPDLAGAPRALFLFVTTAAVAVGAAYLAAAGRPAPRYDEPARPLRLVEWALPVVLLDLLFGAFVLVQVTTLFAGDEHVRDPDGPTYAEYARSGFWQLLAVTALTLGVLAVVARLAGRGTSADRVAIRIAGGALAALTLVIVASALRRLWLYEEAYGYTRLRLVVGAVELGLGWILVLVLAAGVRLRGRWLPRTVLASTAVGLLAFAALNPDRFIAGQNVDRYERTGRIDFWYLSNLSADAAPELDRLTGTERRCALQWIHKDLREQRDTWYTYNAGRDAARRIDVRVGTC